MVTVQPGLCISQTVCKPRACGHPAHRKAIFNGRIPQTVQLTELLPNMQHRHNREEIDMRQLRVALAGLGSRGKDTYAKTAKLFPGKK